MSKANKRKQNFNHQNPLQGWPGYRNRPNRTGFDPLDTRMESAHMEGNFYRQLFTLKLRTRNPFYLFFLFLFGVAPFFFTLIALHAEISIGSSIEIPKFICPMFLLIPTLFLSINFFLSILQILGLISAPRSNQRKKRK